MHYKYFFVVSCVIFFYCKISSNCNHAARLYSLQYIAILQSKPQQIKNKNKICDDADNLIRLNSRTVMRFILILQPISVKFVIEELLMLFLSLGRQMFVCFFLNMKHKTLELKHLYNSTKVQRKR